MNYVDVASIDAALETAVKLGAKVALAKMPVSDMGAVAASWIRYLRSLGADQEVDSAPRRTDRQTKNGCTNAVRRASCSI